MLPVIVPALRDDCPAALALAAEAVPFELVLMRDAGHYGRLLAERWARGFVVVEHDVVPWPGAVRELAECAEPWCAFPYPNGASGELCAALGCTKVAAGGEAPARLLSTPWHEVDGVLFEELGPQHGHLPPVAHTRDFSDVRRLRELALAGRSGTAEHRDLARRTARRAPDPRPATWLVSAVDPSVRPSYRAVHRDRECGQFKRIARHAITVPDEFVRYFSPCSFCVPPAQAWRPPGGRVPRALADWYRAARA